MHFRTYELYQRSLHFFSEIPGMGQIENLAKLKIPRGRGKTNLQRIISIEKLSRVSSLPPWMR